jgi:hypothetical protein
VTEREREWAWELGSASVKAWEKEAALGPRTTR